MKKTLLTCLICASLLSLCSCSGNSPVQTAGSSSEAQNDNGIEQVTLKVWAEEAAFDTMNEMIESFKEAHRGEAEFNITIEQNLDSKTKDVILGDVHNGADVFPLPDDQLSAMAAAGVLSAIPNQEEVSAANTAESVAAASINGVMYAYPMTADNGYFLYYNKKFLNESDVSSLERILEVCEEKNKEFSMEFNSGWYMYCVEQHRRRKGVRLRLRRMQAPHLSGRGKAGADGVVHRLQNDGRQLLQRAPRMGAQTRGLVHQRAEPDAFL